MNAAASSAIVAGLMLAGCTMDVPARGTASATSAPAARAPDHPPASPELMAQVATGEVLGDFASEAEARAAWSARASGRPAYALIGGRWGIAFAADGNVYRLPGGDRLGSGDNQRPPQ